MVTYLTYEFVDYVFQFSNVWCLKKKKPTFVEFLLYVKYLSSLFTFININSHDDPTEKDCSNPNIMYVKNGTLGV